MFVVGIVGSPAGGKSTVAAYLQELGATWINADKIARTVLEEDEVQKQLIDHFGPEIAGSSGQIDRSKLASRVFGDDDAKRRALEYLEGLIHPRTRLIVIARLRLLQQQRTGVAILDVPLLFESGWDRLCDEVWCVDSDPTLRLQRAERRGWGESELHRREANQLPIEEKRRLSNVVIDNNHSLEYLHRTVDQLWNSILDRQSRLDRQQDDDMHCRQDD